MLVYIILSLAAIVANLFGIIQPGSKRSRVSLIVAWGLFLLIVGLRYHHGDYGGYEEAFYLDKDISGDEGYFMIQKVFHSVIPSFVTFVFVVTLISVFCFKKIFSLLPCAAFGLVMVLGKLFTMYAMSGVRQYLAMAICWWGLYESLAKDKDKYFILSVVVAYTIHGSALVFFPVIIFKYMRFTFVRALLVTGAAWAAFEIINPIILSSTEDNELFYRMQDYLISDGSGTMNMLNYLENGLFLTLAILCRRRAIKVIPYYDCFLFIYLVYFVFLLLGSEFGIFKRLRDYYAIGYAFICPGFMLIFKNKDMQRVVYLVLVLYFIFLMFRSFSVFDSGLPAVEGRMVPYHSIFQYL